MEQEGHKSILNTQSKDFPSKKKALFSLRSCVALLARGAAYLKNKETLGWFFVAIGQRKVLLGSYFLGSLRSRRDTKLFFLFFRISFSRASSSADARTASLAFWVGNEIGRSHEVNGHRGEGPYPARSTRAVSL